jgi:hypothetical protein
MRRESAHQAVRRLGEIRNRYGSGAAGEKLELLERISASSLRSARDVVSFHQTLCFLRAFPDSQAVHNAAKALLGKVHTYVEQLPEHQASRLADSGIGGTDLHYHFSYEVARWMAKRFPSHASIDWPEYEDSARLDELLEHLLEDTEAEYFDSGYVSTDEWLELASGATGAEQFDWLMSQLADRRLHGRFWTALYNAAELPLRCELGTSGLSKTHNVFEPDEICFRQGRMRTRVPNARREINRPLKNLILLDPRSGRRLIDVAMASLAVRHRETNHFNHANPREVYLADVGDGVSVAVTGLRAEHRYPLETTMGFLILSNGVPVGYGGSSALFRQANTGINIFDEFRGSEAAWLWVQVMRTFRELTGCNRFVANPYQFGAGNTEALRSGAFWFYYRMGFRSVDRDVRQLAAEEYKRLADDKTYRTPVATLRKLAACDMHLKLLGARQRDFFEESWLEFGALLATQTLAATGRKPRRKALDQLTHELAVILGVESMSDWSREERKWFIRWSPIVMALRPDEWPVRERRHLLALIRAKGGARERAFALAFGRAGRFYAELRKACASIASVH